jgi:hypothetical protein
VNEPVDCGLTDAADGKWTLALHNPSAIDQNFVRLQAPYSGAFKVFIGGENQEWI